MVTARKDDPNNLERIPADHDPVYSVDLDAGSFSWLLEMLYAKTRTSTWIQPYQRLVKRTIISFEEAKRRVEDPDYEPVTVEPPPPRKRTIPRQTKRVRKQQRRES